MGGGNNSVSPEKELKKDALEKYLTGGFNIAAIKTQVTNGKNSMPAFGEKLGPDDIEDVANYVFGQADGDMVRACCRFAGHSRPALFKIFGHEAEVSPWSHLAKMALEPRTCGELPGLMHARDAKDAFLPDVGEEANKQEK